MIDFKKMWEICKDKTMLSEKRFKIIYKEIEKLEGNNHPMVEVGVFRGGVSKMFCLSDPARKVHLFDTFQGMPDQITNNDVMKNNKVLCGEFTDLNFLDVIDYFGDCNNSIFHVGLFPDTAKGLEDEIFSLCHIDCDLYFSCRESMIFFYPRLCDNGVIIIDDYDRPECPGVKISIDDFCHQNNIKIEILKDFQAIIRK